MRALLRRGDPPPERPLPDQLELGDARIDFVSYVASRKGKPVHRTAREFAVLRYLAAHEGDVITRETLLNRNPRRS